MITPKARFEEFLHDINPSPSTISNSQSAHSDIRNVIENDQKFKFNVKRTFLGGSYMRNTALRPAIKNGKEKRPDIDSYVVVQGNYFDASPEQWMNEVYAVLNRNRDGLGLTKITRNRCSLATTTKRANVDVSVLLEKDYDGLYRIGNKDTGAWYPTNPEIHTQWSGMQNARFQNYFKPMVKLLKWAMKENPTNHKHPKSFALEVMIAENLKINSTHYGEIFLTFCKSFLENYFSQYALGSSPFLEDPAVPNTDILAGVENEAFHAFYNKIDYFCTHAEKALEATTDEIATGHWRKIFGSRFPANKINITPTLKPTQVVSPTVFGNRRTYPPALPARFA